MTFLAATSPPSEKPFGVLSTHLATGSLISFRICSSLEEHFTGDHERDRLGD